MSLEFCGSGSGSGSGTATFLTSGIEQPGTSKASGGESLCHSADGTSFIAKIRGLYQFQFNGIFWARGKGRKCSGCPESVSMQVCLDNSCEEPGIV